MSDRPLHPILELGRARIVEFLRDPAALFWTFGFPLFVTLALGLAFNSRTERTRAVAVIDGSPHAVWIEEALGRDGDENLAPRRLSREEAMKALRRGTVDVVAEGLPVRSPGRAESPGAPAAVALHHDPSRTESAASRLAAEDALQSGMGRADPLAIELRAVEEQGSRYIDFLIPGLLGMNLMVTSLWGIGFVAVKARSTQLLKWYASTPMRRLDYLLALLLSRLAFLVLEAGSLLVMGYLLFRVVVRGSWLDLILLLVLGALIFAGIALLAASRTSSIEAISGLMNLVLIPAALLSGTFFSYTSFPDFLQPFIRVLPLTALNDSLRAIVNDGAPLIGRTGDLVVMAVWGGVSFLLAVRLFRWR
ncbi:MAG: ABC transporter permease [Acidobacteriota bacterium]|jgi:ABC-type multidrug transport system permease subunit